MYIVPFFNEINGNFVNQSYFTGTFIYCPNRPELHIAISYSFTATAFQCV